MDKGTTGQTVMTVLSELLLETDVQIPFGRLESTVKKKLRYLKDGRTRSVRKAVNSLVSCGIAQVSKNGFGENTYSLKFESYHDLWKIILFIYDNAPPFHYDDLNDRIVLRPPGYPMGATRGPGTYWFDIIVSFISNFLLNDAKVRAIPADGSNLSEHISYPEILRGRNNKKEITEGAFVALVAGNVLRRKMDKKEGIDVEEPIRFWNIRFTMSVEIDHWLKLIDGLEKPYNHYTYFVGRSYNINKWDQSNWPNDNEIEGLVSNSLLRDIT